MANEIVRLLMWIIPIMVGLSVIFLLYFRFVVVPSALFRGDITENTIKVAPARTFSSAVMAVILFLLCGILACEFIHMRNRQRHIGARLIRERLAGVNYLYSQLDEIYADISRFDQVPNQGIVVNKVIENAIIDFDSIELHTEFEVQRDAEATTRPQIRWEFGRVTEIEDVRLQVFYGKKGVRKKIEQEEISITPKPLITKKVGMVCVELGSDVFDENGQAVISFETKHERVNPDDPLFYYYINPRDYGQERINLDLTLRFLFDVSHIRFSIFSSSTNILSVPRPCQPDFECLQECRLRGSLGKRSLRIVTTSEEGVQDPFVMLFGIPKVSERMEILAFADYASSNH